MDITPKCKYWDNCYQKNPQHLAKFRHPQNHDPHGHSNADPSVGQTVLSTTTAISPERTKTPNFLVESETEEESDQDELSIAKDDAPLVVLDGDTAPEDLIEELPAEDGLACIDGIRPLKILQDGETTEVSSKTSSATYTIKRTADHYYCTCPAWRNQGAVPLNARTCKHLKELLGEEYELARYSANGGPSTGTSAGKRKRAGDGGVGPPGKKTKAVPPKLLLANPWNIATGPDPTGWWLSEKLDGVRALWDPQQKTFVSRLGNPFTAPDWFTKDLPNDMSLDGELFCGRGQFTQTISVVKTINSKQWSRVLFHVFDTPSLHQKPFEERIDAIKTYVNSKHNALEKIVRIVEQVKCDNRAHLMDMLKKVEAQGGEGLMMRKAGSLYEGKRSATLLKVKTFFDAEAKVLGYEPGKGKHKGSTGALKCIMESGKLFKIGTGLSDQERRNPPPVGAIVTYRFQELTPDGVPRFPSYVGVRVDVDCPKDHVP
ncbi:uncharacterized protein SPPG_06617 [Spizellomyces punctatus DAOM BR117]|uniref:SWIM-type domain-containing protein n=1 Tax=Spizellomyces punctatus (strain DAOM BR117) TaxID=645134 RepID=A0A0L0HAM2_SPIPD|nr:uncharacterized protein SPPG_06617 [Spizellomyces punctatus DAOM BR117]KNC98217.1 hypothetical protein SPPG_06617 [Spizellomyces punctatus DAOM BR117]|eukprot:XP_016606257.1 hypothetical protein SPPG_06617 [Spizellomyces punctatus DAOM BR117]